MLHQEYLAVWLIPSGYIMSQQADSRIGALGIAASAK
jgi:hypothetical protein